MAWIDDQGKWVGAGPSPLQVGATSTAPAQFDVNAIPTVAVPQGKTIGDWTNLLQANSGYLGWKLGAGQRADIAKGQRTAALRALAVRYGGMPQGFQDPYGDIDPTTGAVARDNPFSETARVARDYATSQENFRRSLSARGALQSGDLGYGLDQLSTQHGADLYDLNNQFSNAAQQAINDYVGSIVGLSQEQIAAIQAAAQAVYSQGYQLGGGDSGAPPADQPVAPVDQTAPSVYPPPAGKPDPDTGTLPLDPNYLKQLFGQYDVGTTPWIRGA